MQADTVTVKPWHFMIGVLIILMGLFMVGYGMHAVYHPQLSQAHDSVVCRADLACT